MLLSELVATSHRVAESRSRRAKIAMLAPQEIRASIHCLCGTLPQGCLGVGYAAIRDARPATALVRGQLSLCEVNDALGDAAAG